MVANKPIRVQKYTITGSSKHYVTVYYATPRKQFHIINHSRIIAIIATVANGTVRLSIGLRLVRFIGLHVFQKGDANGHHEIEAWQKLLSLNKQLGGSCCFGFIFKVPVLWFVRHLVMLKSLKKL